MTTPSPPSSFSPPPPAVTLSLTPTPSPSSHSPSQPTHHQSQAKPADPLWVTSHRPLTPPTSSSSSTSLLDVLSEEPPLPKQQIQTQTQAQQSVSNESPGKKLKSTLPLGVAQRLDFDLVLVVAGESLDLSGDVGAVGRVKVEGGSRNKERKRKRVKEREVKEERGVWLDLKGSMYRIDWNDNEDGNMGGQPSGEGFGCCCVVSVGAEEAKVVGVVREDHIGVLTEVDVGGERIVQGSRDSAMDLDEHEDEAVDIVDLDKEEEEVNGKKAKRDESGGKKNRGYNERRGKRSNIQKNAPKRRRVAQNKAMVKEEKDY